jgi:hypothetical protein
MENPETSATLGKFHKRKKNKAKNRKLKRWATTRALPGWTQVLAKFLKFLFLTRHPPCYWDNQVWSKYLKFLFLTRHPPCYWATQVKALSVIYVRPNLHKRQNIHCHLRNGYFVNINQFVMTTVDLSDDFNLEAT